MYINTVKPRLINFIFVILFYQMTIIDYFVIDFSITEIASNYVKLNCNTTFFNGVLPLVMGRV